jgi:acyl-CoA oxidase
METLSYHDLSLVIKFEYNLTLGMSVKLGTEKHYSKYLQDIGSLKLQAVLHDRDQSRFEC